MLRDVTHIVAIYQHCTLLYIVETRKQPGNRAFPCPRRPHDSYSLTGLHVQVEVLQHRQVTIVAECDISELHLAVYLGQLLRTRLVLYFDRRLQDLKNAHEWLSWCRLSASGA